MKTFKLETLVYYMLYVIFAIPIIRVVTPVLLESFNTWQAFGIACLMATGVYHIVYHIVKPLVTIIREK